MLPNCADMGGRRILYLTALMICGIFYIAYGQWLSWFLLVLVLALPWFSLILSLPAMLRFRISPGGPAALELNGQGELWLMGACPLPMPPFRGRLKLKHCITGKTWYYQEMEDLRTDHCGGIQVTPEAVKVCDYLGLFSMPVRRREPMTILVRPSPVKMDLEREVQRYTARSWQPKSGGGYAENHELRLYRPGDSLNQVHWKLSAKTGDLIIREPMEPQQGLVLLTMHLRGKPEQIDRKFGRLLWLGNCLLENGIRFELRALTGEGLETFCVSEETDLNRAVSTLLCRKAAQEGDLREQETAASWHCHIGGGPDEA